MSYKFSTGSVRQGDVYFEDDDNGAPTYIDFDQDTITLRPSGSQILHAKADAVGIGTTTPDYTLHVAGDMGVNQYIYHNGDNNTWINFTENRIRLNAGGNNFIKLELIMVAIILTLLLKIIVTMCILRLTHPLQR